MEVRGGQGRHGEAAGGYQWPLGTCLRLLGLVPVGAIGCHQCRGLSLGPSDHSEEAGRAETDAAVT